MYYPTKLETAIHQFKKDITKNTTEERNAFFKIWTRNEKSGRLVRKGSLKDVYFYIRKMNGMSEHQKLVYLCEIATKITPKRRKRFSEEKYVQRRICAPKLKQDCKCYVCRKRKAYCLHHIIPLANGGTNHKRNLIPVCRSCHITIHPFLKKENADKPWIQEKCESILRQVRKSNKNQI